jgi:hypothetical protein
MYRFHDEPPAVGVQSMAWEVRYRAKLALVIWVLWQFMTRSGRRDVH